MSPEKWLKLVLRVFGGVTLAALPFAFAPLSSLAWCHDRLGLGPLPEGAVVEYLARSLSAFYAILGGLLLLVSRDVRRHSAVIVYLAVVCIVAGPLVTVLDALLALPWWWTLGEGPPLVPLGAAMLLLVARARR